MVALDRLTHNPGTAVAVKASAAPWGGRSPERVHIHGQFKLEEAQVKRSRSRSQCKPLRRGASAIAAALLLASCTGEVSSRPDAISADKGGQSGTGNAGGAQGGKPAQTGGQTTPDDQEFVSTFACGDWQSLPRDPGPAPLRRLSRSEYLNSLHDLLGEDAANAATSLLPGDERSGGFDNNALVLSVSYPLIEGYLRASEQVATQAATRLSSLIPCGTTDACATQFIESFGRKVWRRPLTTTEKAQLFELFTAGKVDGGFSTGVAWVLQAMLQSSAFIYRMEPGASAESDLPGALRIQDFEMASRLSYFLWRSTPDDALLTAAETGKLRAAADIRAQAARMLDDPRAKSQSGILAFFEQWLGLDTVASLTKDAATYPNFTPALAAAMKAESDRFLQWWLWTGDARFSTLLTAPTTFVDGTSAKSYAGDGIVMPSGSAVQELRLDPQRRSGILTQPAVMARYAYAKQSSPNHRGIFVAEKLLCFHLPPPPADLNAQEPQIQPGLTTRERFAAHGAAACASCHKFIDPPGNAFENYDAVGSFRTQELGKPIDASFQIDPDVTSDANLTKPMNGAAELGRALAQSASVQRCFATTWFRYAAGRAPEMADERSVCGAFAAMNEANGDVRTLILALTQSDAFLYRRAPNTSMEGCTP